jgi:hypothetical protein
LGAEQLGPPTDHLHDVGRVAAIELRHRELRIDRVQGRGEIGDQLCAGRSRFQLDDLRTDAQAVRYTNVR